MTAPLLKASNISVHFTVRAKGQLKVLQAVNDVTLSIFEGETLGLVGESGSGKSTAGDAAIGLQKLTSGDAYFRDQVIPSQNRPEWRALRRKLQIVFQDPFSSLNPRHTVGQALREPLLLHKLADGKLLQTRVETLLEQVGLSGELAERYPAALSGGQRQRVCIARALAVEPELIVCDEITSALDVSTQAQIISLLLDLQKSTGLAYLFISHDLGLVRGFADRIAVMYLGKIVETGSANDIFSHTRHPYTQALISAAPVPDPEFESLRPRNPLRGEIPDPTDPPTGCRFRTRCPHAISKCAQEAPDTEEVQSGHFVACHRWRSLSLGVEELT